MQSQNMVSGAVGRKHTKAATTPCSCLRACMKLPATLVFLYKGSPRLRCFLRWLFSVILCVFLLCVIPLSFYSNRSKEHFGLIRTLEIIFIGWSTLLVISPWIVIVMSSIAGFSLARQCHKSKMIDGEIITSKLPAIDDENVIYNAKYPTRNNIVNKSIEILKRPKLRKFFYVTGLSFFIMAIISIQTNLQMMYPSWLWNPFLLGYNVYWPKSLADASVGLCVKEELNQSLDSTKKDRLPLCLPEKSWKTLSTDVISSKNKNDVQAVINGIRFLEKDSSGIAFGLMSRDTINALKPLRENVESLLPFTKNVAVVVFENDSNDGTRDAFYKWSKEVEGQYVVDVMECEDSPGCIFRQSHRDFEKDIPYEKTSAIGKMGEFRQRLVDHVVMQPKYANYSHFLVLDVDLSVSISPLGILHSIGKLPNEAVASSGRQARPGSLGSLQPPYDFSAFVAHENMSNNRMLKLNELFCALKPEGYRWRNECTAVSVAQFMMIQGGDKLNDGEPYLVDSAFNGAVLYPIDLIRESQAKYDAGKDGQRCEHIGFNLSLKKPMYINPKWNMHLHPRMMGGPSGKRAMRTVKNIMKSPIIAPILLGQSFFSMLIFIYCCISLSMLILYPLWVFVSRAATRNSEYSSIRMMCERPRASHKKELECLLNPELGVQSRKRKVSEFDDKI